MEMKSYVRGSTTRLTVVKVEAYFSIKLEPNDYEHGYRIEGVAGAPLFSNLADVYNFMKYHGKGLVLTENWESSRQPREDKHVGCPSYPNCDEAPLGCAVRMGKNVEWYGNRD